jgi:hypothetical protein
MIEMPDHAADVGFEPTKSTTFHGPDVPGGAEGARVILDVGLLCNGKKAMNSECPGQYEYRITPEGKMEVGAAFCASPRQSVAALPGIGRKLARLGPPIVVKG